MVNGPHWQTSWAAPVICCNGRFIIKSILKSWPFQKILESLFFLYIKLPDLILLARDWTICEMHRTTISRIWPDLLFFMINSKGRRKSFWKWKFCNSPFSKNFKLNCFKESVAKMAICCESLHPTTLKWFPKTAHIRDLETTTFFYNQFSKSYW